MKADVPPAKRTKKKPRKSPAFQFYPSNFLGSPKVRAMNAAQVGVYWLLCCIEWEHDGFTIEDAQECAESVAVTAKAFDAMWAKLSRCFVERNGRFFSPRLDQEREKQASWRRKSSKGGKLGMKKRWGNSDKGGNEMVIPPDNTPSLSPSLPPVTKKTTAPGAPRAGWLDPVAAVYEAAKGSGSFPWAKAGKLLKPLHDAGHSGETIAERLSRYVAWLDDQKYFSLSKFRETFGDYAEKEPAAIRALKGYPKIVDEFGQFTEYGERVTRPNLKLA